MYSVAGCLIVSWGSQIRSISFGAGVNFEILARTTLIARNIVWSHCSARRSSVLFHQRVIFYGWACWKIKGCWDNALEQFGKVHCKSLSIIRIPAMVKVSDLPISMNCFKSLGQPRKSRCSHSQWNKNSPALLARSNSMVMSSTPQFQQKQNELERRDQITDTSPWWWSWKMTVTEKRGQFFNGCWPKSPRAFGCRALYVTERKRGSAGLTKNVAVQAILTKEFYPLQKSTSKKLLWRLNIFNIV